MCVYVPHVLECVPLAAAADSRAVVARGFTPKQIAKLKHFCVFVFLKGKKLDTTAGEWTTRPKTTPFKPLT